MVGVELDPGEGRAHVRPAVACEQRVAGDEPVVVPVDESMTEGTRVERRREECDAAAHDGVEARGGHGSDGITCGRVAR